MDNNIYFRICISELAKVQDNDEHMDNKKLFIKTGLVKINFMSKLKFIGISVSLIPTHIGSFGFLNEDPDIIRFKKDKCLYIM